MYDEYVSLRTFRRFFFTSPSAGAGAGFDVFFPPLADFSVVFAGALEAVAGALEAVDAGLGGISSGRDGGVVKECGGWKARRVKVGSGAEERGRGINRST